MVVKFLSSSGIPNRTRHLEVIMEMVWKRILEDTYCRGCTWIEDGDRGTQGTFDGSVNATARQIVHDILAMQVSGRGFLGLSQSGVSAHPKSEPSAVSSGKHIGGKGLERFLLMADGSCRHFAVGRGITPYRSLLSVLRVSNEDPKYALLTR